MILFYERINMNHKFALLGSSRGLGWETYQLLCQIQSSSIKSQSNNSKDDASKAVNSNETDSKDAGLDFSFFLASRKIADKKIQDHTTICSVDFSKTEVDGNFLQQLKNFNPTTLIYFAAGGPYGSYANHKWNSHMWAMQTSFLTPAYLLHWILSKRLEFNSLRQIIFIGSAIAEAQGDLNAASYAAAKHALKGLITSVQLEESFLNTNENQSQLKLELFSPGYMQTELLPQNSRPRLQKLAENPVDVAKKLIAMLQIND